MGLGGLFYFYLSKNKIKIVSENFKNNTPEQSIINTETVIINNENNENTEIAETNNSEAGEKLEAEETNNNSENKKTIIAEEIKKDNSNKKSNDIKEVKIIIKNKLVNWGFTKSSRRKIDTIILHSSYDALGDNPYNTDGLIAEYKQYGVAPHYLIDRKGNIYRLVENKNIAWHAGKSEVPDGRKNVNEFSIGVEIMNTKTDSYTKKQYQAVQNLIDYLKKEYTIKYILGHNEIAPGRKTDPWNFDWEEIVK